MIFLYAVARPIYLNTFADANATAVDNTLCDDIDTCRTILDILWNCYSVVILCTWVAVHPNVPTIGDHFTVVLMKYGLIAFMAIVAPELMILWALRQWVSCRRIAEKYKGYGWKKCHAFLVLMGGLALYDGDDFVCHLWDRDNFHDSIDTESGQYRHSNEGDVSWEMRLAIGVENGWSLKKIKDECGPPREQKPGTMAPLDLYKRYSCLLEYLLANGYIRVTEDEIKDKGNADALTKTIALVQTIWFILQCSARVAQGLDVTPIEVVVFAFAILNFVTYFLWWNKPLRIRYPVRVYLPRRCPLSKKVSPKIGTWKKLCNMARACGQGIDAAVKCIAKDYDSLKKTGLFTFIKWRIFVPLYPIAALSTRFRDLCVGFESDNCRYLFSSRLEKDKKRIHATAYMTAVIFAAIHLIPWFFPFPTIIEQRLWRVSAIFVTSAPIIFCILQLSVQGVQNMIRRVGEQRDHDARRRRRDFLALKVVGTIWMILMSLLFILYVPSRIALIVLALTALRDIPLDGYAAVQWNAFIPHIG